MLQLSRWAKAISGFFVLSTVFVNYPSQAESINANSPNGNYRVCSKLPVDGQQSGMCFLFHKVGNRVVGDFYQPYTDLFICVSGKIHNNVVNGEALQSDEMPGEPARLDSKAQGSILTSWDDSGYLKVGRGSVKNTYHAKDSYYTSLFKYRVAKLDLKGFYRYNAGTTLPPRSCKK